VKCSNDKVTVAITKNEELEEEKGGKETNEGQETKTSKCWNIG